MRFERDVCRAAVCTNSRLFESDRFGVNYIAVNISSLANYLAVSRNDDAPDERVRADKADAFGGDFERASDKTFVVRLFGCSFYDFFGFLALPRYFSSGLFVVIGAVRLQLETPGVAVPVELE